MSFVSFCTTEIGYQFTPAQRVLMLVAVDGVQPGSLPPVEREMAYRLFGEVADVPDEARRVVVAVLGRGSGKDDLGALYGLWRMLTADCSAVGPGDVPTFIIVAPDKPTAAIAVKRALARARSVPSIARLIESETADGFTLRRPDGVVVALEVLAATRGGSAVRGRSVLGALMSEAAFFRDSDSIVNDADIFAALMPRLMRGGAILLFSTPWAEMGLLWELYSANYGRPRTAVVAQADTLTMRDHDADMRVLWDLEHERDVDNAARELGAKFTGAGGSSAYRAEWIEPSFRPAGQVYALGHPVGVADFADGGKDWATWCVAMMVVQPPQREIETYDEVQADGSIVTIESRDPSGNPRWKPYVEPVPFVLMYGWGAADPATRAAVGWERLVQHIGQHWHAYGVKRAYGDSFQAGPTASAMRRSGITYESQTWSQTTKIEALARTRNWFRDKTIIVEGAEHNERIRRELLNLSVRPTPGGGQTIAARRSGHDDFAALVLNCGMLDASGALRGSPVERKRGVSTTRGGAVGSMFNGGE